MNEGVDNETGRRVCVNNKTGRRVCVRTGSGTDPPRGERAPMVGISSTIIGVRSVRAYLPEGILSACTTNRVCASRSEKEVVWCTGVPRFSGATPPPRTTVGPSPHRGTSHIINCLTP